MTSHIHVCTFTEIDRTFKSWCFKAVVKTIFLCQPIIPFAHFLLKTAKLTTVLQYMYKKGKAFSKDTVILSVQNA